jgi:uncharacterized membrane protein
MHSFCPHPTFKRNTSKNHFGFTVTALPTGLRLIATRFPRKDNLDGIERIALSFGLSVAITPFWGLALNYTPFGIRLTPILIVLSVFTIALAISAWARRSRIPDEDRFVVDFVVLFKSIKESVNQLK